MKKIRNFVSTYSVELLVLVLSISMKAYAYSLIGPREGQGLGELLMLAHNLKAYSTVSTICETIVVIDLIVMIIHYVFVSKGIKVKFLGA